MAGVLIWRDVSLYGRPGVDDLTAIPGNTKMRLSGGVAVRFDGSRVEFGRGLRASQVRSTAECRKNIETERCALDFIRSIAIGKSITSAADLAYYYEVGLDRRLHMGLHAGGFFTYSQPRIRPMSTAYSEFRV